MHLDLDPEDLIPIVQTVVAQIHVRVHTSIAEAIHVGVLLIQIINVGAIVEHVRKAIIVYSSRTSDIGMQIHWGDFDNKIVANYSSLLVDVDAEWFKRPRC